MLHYLRQHLGSQSPLLQHLRNLLCQCYWQETRKSTSRNQNNNEKNVPIGHRNLYHHPPTQQPTTSTRRRPPSSSSSSSSSSSPSKSQFYSHLQYLISQQHKLHNIQSKLHTNPTRQRRLFWYLIWCYSEICWHSWQRNAAGDFKCADGAIECDHVGTDILGCCPGWPETASKRLLMPGVNVGTYSPNTRFSCCLLIWKH